MRGMICETTLSQRERDLPDRKLELARFSHDGLIHFLENIHLKWMFDHVACEVCDNRAYLDSVRAGSPRRLRDEEPSGFLAVDLNTSIDDISGGIDDDELPLEECVIHGFGEFDADRILSS